MLHFNGSKIQKIQKVQISVSILEKYIFFNMHPWLPSNSPMAPWGAMAPSLGTTVLEDLHGSHLIILKLFCSPCYPHRKLTAGHRDECQDLRFINCSCPRQALLCQLLRNEVKSNTSMSNNKQTLQAPKDGGA